MTFTSFQLNMYHWVEFTDNTDNWNPYFITRSGSVPSFTVYSTGRGQLGVMVKGLKGRTGTGPGFFATYTMVPAAGKALNIPDILYAKSCVYFIRQVYVDC